MRTIISSFVVTLALCLAFIGVGDSTGCASSQKVVTAAGSAAVCLGVDCMQIVKADGVSIVSDIYTAVVTGGAALPALVSDLVADFGPATIQCASIIVDAITGVTPPPPPNLAIANMNQSTNATMTSQGRSALEAEMKKRGWWANRTR